MNGTWTLPAGTNGSGGVNWYVPGSLFGGVQVIPGEEWSLARIARICLATSAPIATPCMASPGGMPARSAVSLASKIGLRDGYRTDRVSWAAWATAAVTEAPLDAW